MTNELMDTRWNEVLSSLEAEGLPKEKAREVLPKAVNFLFEVDRRRHGAYLEKGTIETRKETFGRLITISQKYPAVRGFLAHVVLEEVKKEGQLKTGQILQICGMASRLGLVLEWTYLGKESRKWRLVGRDSGEVGIHPNVLNAGVHVFDFRSDDPTQRRMRHFLPADWRNRSQTELTNHLANEVRRNDEEYKASHPKPEPKVTGTETTPVGATEPTEPELTEPTEKPAPAPRTSRRKTGAANDEGEPTTPKTTKVAKTKGGRSGAKRQAVNEALTDETEA